MLKLHFNLGGHNCHDLYFKNLLPVNMGGGVLPSNDSKLIQAINQVWGNVDSFIQDFNSRTLAI